jgi:hypothetical protein
MPDSATIRIKLEGQAAGGPTAAAGSAAAPAPAGAPGAGGRAVTRK